MITPTNVTGKLTFSVYDTFGKMIHTEIRAGAEPFEFGEQDLSTGIYFYKIDSDLKKPLIGKFIKL